MEQQCLFCAIVGDKIPSYKVYEDNQFVAILDINPSNPGHLMLIPKQHVVSIMELSDTDMAKFFLVARGLSLALLEYGAKGINFLYGMGEAAGQRTPHAFMHIIPRYENDKVSLVWEPKKFSEDDFKNQQQKILQIINNQKQQIQQYQQQQPQQYQQHQPHQSQQQQQQTHQQNQQVEQYPQQFHQPKQAQPQQQQSIHAPQHPVNRPQQTHPRQPHQQHPRQSHQQHPQQSQQPQQQSQQPQQQSSEKKKKLEEMYRKTGGYW